MIHPNDYEVKMRDYNSEEYKEKMIQVYGESVVCDFEKFEYRQNPSFPETYNDFKGRMERYVSRIGNINEGIKEIKHGKARKKVSNYYENKGFARFILISIEKYYGETIINLAEIKSKSENKVVYEWETEHILPQKNEGKYERCYVQSLGNLTLISQELNVRSTNHSYEEKRKLFMKREGKEKEFYINKLYRRKTFEKQDVDKRYKRLKSEFLKIFSENKSKGKFTLDKFEKIIGF